jgi:hypothetical protein
MNFPSVDHLSLPAVALLLSLSFVDLGEAWSEFH